MGRVPIWYGPEVEGRLRHGRVRTAFIDEWPRIAQVSALQNYLLFDEVKHVFLTENYQDFLLFEDMVLPHMRDHHALTIGAWPENVDEVLRLPFIHRASIVVRANLLAPWVRQLRPGDQVAVGVPYDLVTFEMKDGVRSEPEDYKDDKL